MELENLATLTSRDDTIDEMHDQIAGLNTELDTLQQKLDAAAKETSERQERLESSERKLAETKQSMDAKNVQNSELQEEIVRLRVDKEYMRFVTDKLQSKVCHLLPLSPLSLCRTDADYSF